MFGCINTKFIYILLVVIFIFPGGHIRNAHIEKENIGPAFWDKVSALWNLCAIAMVFNEV